MKLLIGVDGSAGSLAAVSLGGRLVSSDKDEVGLYYSPPKVDIHGGADTAEVPPAVHDSLAKAVFEKSSGQLPSPLRDRVHTIVNQKPARQGLVLAADQWRADMIAVGARGLGPIASIMMGSVASSVAHAASVPVLVVRPVPSNRPEGRLHVLLAYDGSQASQQAAEALDKLHWPTGTTGQAMTVIEPMSLGPMPDWLEKTARDAETEAMAQAWAEDHQRHRQAALDELTAFCKKLPEPFHAQQPIVAEGHPAEQLLQRIDQDQIDLAVVGAQGKSAWERMLMGSTSQTILQQAPCSVLLVHQHQRP